MSLQTLKGIVSEVSEKPFTDNRTGEDILLYSFQIESDRRWFRTGTNRPAFKTGDAIGFAVNTAKNNAVDLNDVQEVNADEISAAPKPPARGNASGYKKKGPAKGGENWEARQAYWENKEKRDLEVVEPRITYAASQRDAVAVVTAALAHDALSFGSTTKGKKLDLMLDQIDQVTERFYKKRMNLTDAAVASAPTRTQEEDEYDGES